MNFSWSENASTAHTATFCSSAVNKSLVPTAASSDSTLLVWQYLAALLSLLGTVSNLFVLIVVLRQPALRAGAGIFVAHLLLCHLALCSVTFPVIIYYINRAYRLFDIDCGACRYRHVLHVAFNNLVSWSDALLAMNRIVAVFFPIHYRYIIRKSVQFLALALIWLNATWLALFPTLDYLASYKPTPLGTCFLAIRNSTFRIMFSITFTLPLVLMGLAAFSVLGKLAWVRRSRRTVVAAWPAAVHATVMSERQTRASLMMLGCFAVSLVSQVASLVQPLIVISVRYPALSIYLWLLSWIQYSFTPIIFLALNKDYRNGAKLFFSSGTIPSRTSRHSRW
ncbi:hypothetical protein BV898_07572 [Hypsibius exemplaris]|uniref:G-protein coupled receptors family 1 profile domain-containing protein n=1 Tax=Hypsibius exemplaris TaxID=2072580 RepID=A0A1W0WT39_HYPEX|nr:hypothetical protein BV898_07572 [Hypsibius exemplaris]